MGKKKRRMFSPKFEKWREQNAPSKQEQHEEPIVEKQEVKPDLAVNKDKAIQVEEPIAEDPKVKKAPKKAPKSPVAATEEFATTTTRRKRTTKTKS